MCERQDVGRKPPRPGASFLVPLLLLLACVLSSHCCPEKCLCSSQTVKCQNRGLDAVPRLIPPNTKILFVTGNNITNIDADSFPDRLELLTDLYLGGNEVEHVDALGFDNLPNLSRLDLSNNKIQSFSAFPPGSKLQLLNLSGSLHNRSVAEEVLEFLRSGNLPHLTSLDVSSNRLVVLPDAVFSNLPGLTILNLQNNSLIGIQNVTLKLPLLRDLDLRNNSLRALPAATLDELGGNPELRLRLAGNPWRCDCIIEDLLVWLRNSSQVLDGDNLTCADPETLRRQNLLQLEPPQLKCSGDMERVLETSYVFLGLVLALIGVIFLLVLYLNRKGIKRWIYNIRDACRDHMEGYHYRYEVNSDPRLANLSINSDV